jgi:spermidine synthase
MVIELLGTRLIAPFYGASLYVWSSLISVTMIALAIGYFVGGRWADRTKRTGLSLIIALAALFTLLIPWATRAVLLATDPLGLRAGAFVSALVLFSPSLTLLGMVGPFAIKLSTSRLDGIGNSAGSIYAVSTVGSVLGTLILGFFLFPLVGSRQILIGLGLMLFVLAIIIAIYEQKKLGLSFSLLPCILLAIIGLCLLPEIAGAGHSYTGGNQFKVQSERESLYGWVRVIDQPSRDLRLLTSDASTIGAASISDGQSRMTYQDIVGLIPALAPQKMKRALIIGLGAGHMAKVLHERYGIQADTLEIDPAVAEAASGYFGYKPSGLAIVGDARYEIRHLKGSYDLIIHDCFTGGSEPAHLLTVEALAQLRGLLSEQGILAVNFVAFAKGSAALASVARTVADVFPEQLVFASEPGKDFNDFIFLAANQAINLNSKTLLSSQAGWLNERLIQVDKSQGVLFTDNLNQLEHLQIAKAEHYRHLIVDWFGPELLVR